MRKRSIYRGFLLAAGLVAVLVIILSRTFSESEPGNSVATEQTEAGSSSDQAVIHAPGDAVPQSTLVRVDEQVPVSVLEILSEPERIPRLVIQSETIVNAFIQTLFRVIIAPNAP